MTAFEKRIRDYIAEKLSYEDPEEVCDMTLCDNVTADICGILEGKFEHLLPEGVEEAGIGAANICEPGNNRDYPASSLKYYELELNYVRPTGEQKVLGVSVHEWSPLYGKDVVINVTEAVGCILFRIKYNTTEDCNDLVQAKFIPVGVDEDSVPWEIIH